MSWRWCSRQTPSGARVTRCWNPIRYHGPLGEELCEEHARLLVAEHGLTALAPEDRTRLPAREHPPPADARVKLHLPRPTFPEPVRRGLAEASQLVDEYVRQGHLVLVKSPGQQQPEMFRTPGALPADVTEAWVLPPPSNRQQRDRARQEAARQRRLARSLRRASQDRRERTTRVLEAVRRTLRVSVQVLDARHIHVLMLGREDAAQLMEIHLRMGYLAIAQTRDARVPIGTIATLPPDVTDVWMLPPEPALASRSPIAGR